MAVVESTSPDSAVVVASSTSTPASNGQNQPKQNGVSMVRPHDQGLYVTGNNQNNHGSNGGGDFKHDMRELQELFSKLNPMAEEFVPPSLAKTNGFTGGFFANNLHLLHNPNTGNGNVNANAAVRRVISLLSFLCFLFIYSLGF